MTMDFRKKVPQNIQRTAITAKGVNSVWQVDLADLTGNEAGNNRGYILVAIDVWSRQGFFEPINQKTEAAIVAGLHAIFARAGAKPDRIDADEESGLKAAAAKGTIPEVFHAGSHAWLAESLIGWMRRRLERRRDEVRGRAWRALLPALEEEYNNHIIKSLKISPMYAASEDMTLKDHEKLRQLYAKRAEHSMGTIRKEFTMGCWVLGAKARGEFHKSYHRNWETTPYIITGTSATGMYHVAKAVGTREHITYERMPNKVYAEHLQKITNEEALSLMRPSVRGRTAPNPPVEFQSIIRTRRQAAAEANLK